MAQVPSLLILDGKKVKQVLFKFLLYAFFFLRSSDSYNHEGEVIRIGSLKMKIGENFIHKVEIEKVLVAKIFI